MRRVAQLNAVRDQNKYIIIVHLTSVYRQCTGRTRSNNAHKTIRMCVCLRVRVCKINFTPVFTQLKRLLKYVTF